MVGTHACNLYIKRKGFNKEPLLTYNVGKVGPCIFDDAILADNVDHYTSITRVLMQKLYDSCKLV